MKRVVVTGIGIVAPNGIGKESFWNNSYKGVSFIENDPEMQSLVLKCSTLSRIKSFNLDENIQVDSYPGLNELDRFVQYGIVAGEQALEDARLSEAYQYEPEVGVIFSSAIGGTPSIVDIFEKLTNSGQHPVKYAKVGSRFYNSGMFNHSATLLAKKFQFTGPCLSVSTGCTAGIDAMGLAYDLIRYGEANVVLAGASEAPLTPLTYATLDIINSLSTYNDEPNKSSRPFDAKRSGFVISEGSAVLVLEELEFALKRNAHIYAEVKSYFSLSNASHMNNLSSDGIPMAEVINRTIQLSGLKASDIDYINAHGSSTSQNDLFETNAFKSVFGAHAFSIPISSIKSMIGHSLSSASLMGAICVLGSIRNSIIHPTIIYEHPDPNCDLDYVPNVARNKKVNAGMITASGFGGIHSAAIFSKYRI